MGLEPLRKLRSYETLNRWFSGQTNYFGVLPGSIPGVDTVNENVHFLQNRSTVGLEPAIMQSQGPALAIALEDRVPGGGGMEPSE